MQIVKTGVHRFLGGLLRLRKFRNRLLQLAEVFFRNGLLQVAINAVRVASVGIQAVIRFLRFCATYDRASMMTLPPGATWMCM